MYQSPVQSGVLQAVLDLLWFAFILFFCSSFVIVLFFFFTCHLIPEFSPLDFVFFLLISRLAFDSLYLPFCVLRFIMWKHSFRCWFSTVWIYCTIDHWDCVNITIKVKVSVHLWTLWRKLKKKVFTATTCSYIRLVFTVWWPHREANLIVFIQECKTFWVNLIYTNWPKEKSPSGFN